MRQISANDEFQIQVELIGSNDTDPILVVPGGPCRGPEYLEGIKGLSEIRDLAIIHLRGTPKTGGLSRGWWTDTADLIAVADELNLKNFDVLAHSEGTRLALAATAQFPNRIRSLTLITPSSAWLTGMEHDGGIVAARRIEPEISLALDSMDSIMSRTEEEFQKTLITEAPAGYAKWSLAEQKHAKVGVMSLAAITAWLSNIPNDAATNILNSPIPNTLVIGGSKDILTGVETVKAYAKVLKAELKMIPDCGHYPWVEQPEIFNEILKARYKKFLRAIAL
ncbi:MAG: alpha/beta hydrolase [Micrococcaceae bacterium]